MEFIGKDHFTEEVSYTLTKSRVELSVEGQSQSLQAQGMPRGEAEP